ncbi:MAG: HAMP domain-containing protein [Nitrospiraceae bacterium]|nr:MAG: HAMP domain-containing protein [Nitrospiraceae bacterium]
MAGKFKKWVFSLQGKFIITASFCILIFTTIGSFVILSREEELYKQDIMNQGKVLAEISRLTLTNVMVYKEMGMMDEQNLTDYLDYFIINLMEQDKRVNFVMILDNKGWVLAHSNPSQANKVYMDKSIEEVLINFKTEIAYGGFYNEPVIKITSPLNISSKNWGVIRFGFSLKEVQESINSLRREVFLITVIFSVISLTIISIGAKVLSKPVTRLAGIMDDIKTHGDIEQVEAIHELPVLKDRRDELGELQRSFFWMLQRLRDAGREQKRTTEVLGQTEKMVSVGRLASGVAHEINNPLSGITLCFKNLIEAEVDDGTREKLIFAVNDGLQKIENIVKQLLDFSRMTITEKTNVNLNDLINRLLVLFNYPASKKDVKIVNYLSEDIPELLLDENKMSQVFTNIIINALQAMDGGGTLTIKTEQVDRFCVVSIEDTGTGIPADVMPNIFDPFFTTKRTGEGTGLGLSVSKGIVEKHGGLIEVESQEGAGTIFRIKLPIA